MVTFCMILVECYLYVYNPKQMLNVSAIAICVKLNQFILRCMITLVRSTYNIKSDNVIQHFSYQVR